MSESSEVASTTVSHRNGSIGRSVVASEASQRVNGRLPFTGNVEVPGMLHGKVLRSPHAHALITRLDASKAEALPGVVGVLTGKDLVDGELEAYYGPAIPDRPIVAIDRVRFNGEPVAAVIAEDLDTAEQALDLIEVDYEPLPAVLTPDAAIADDAPELHPDLHLRDHLSFPDLVLHPGAGKNICNYFRLRKGDAEAAMADADEVFHDTFRTPAEQHASIEPHITVAEITAEGPTLWTTSAGPFTARAQIAETLRIPASKVRIIVGNVGGAYGGKTYPRNEPLAVAMSWKVGGRPVKLALTRAEEFYTITRHSSIVEITTGVKRDGTIVARQVRILWGAGAYADISPRLIKNGGYSSNGPYRVDNVSIDSYAVYTNTTPAGGYRGYGIPQVAWAYESQMDMIAERLGIDPRDLRERNLVVEGDSFSTGQTMNDVHLDEMLDIVTDRIGWSDRQTDAGGGSAAPDPGSRKVRGKGLATIVKTTVTPSTSSAALKLNADGSVNLETSSVEIGQGARTVLAQIAADAIGLPYESVRVSYPDTVLTPWDQTTSSSRTTLMMGGAVEEAGLEIRQQLIDLAADALEAAPQDLVVSDGQVSVVGVPSRSVSFGELVRRSRSGNLLAHAVNRSEGGLDPETGQGIATARFYQAAAAAEVEVDLDTGKVDVLDLHVQTWGGRVIHPVLAELQSEGNVAFGVGQALYEEIVVDNGQIVNTNFGDYMIPSFLDYGARWTVGLSQEPDGAGLIHGLGESGCPAVPPAIGNALFAAAGIRVKELPLTPERVLRALRERDAQGDKEAKP
jgi:CO/xanthine dehydrogenase Mo-binding subunit